MIMDKIQLWMYKQKFKKLLRKCFEDSEVCVKKKVNDREFTQYPMIHNVQEKDDHLQVVFRLPKVIPIEKLLSKHFVFQRYFGEHTFFKADEIGGVTMRIYNKDPFKETYIYDYDLYKDQVDKYKVPILVGFEDGGYTFLDLIDPAPHLLIAGQTGMGKSSTVRSILTTLVLSKTPEQVKLFLFDLKRTEFFLFKNLPHVAEFSVDENQIRVHLEEINKEMDRRGDIQMEHEVSSILRLPKHIREDMPIIVVFIDEFQDLDEDTMELVGRVAAKGRSLGLLLALSTQRPDSTVLKGKIKNNLVNRISLKQSNSTNSKIVDCAGAEAIKNVGECVFSVGGELRRAKTVFLDDQRAKEILAPLNVVKTQQQTEGTEEDSKLIQMEEMKKRKKQIDQNEQILQMMEEVLENEKAGSVDH
ncbi:FtsK/SpoIIIE domain-containing protein [Bacillus sp. BML-BC060]|uniref:FtsK/SpoIIIE domain-containing protein n=1 Tax=Bacillus sp. BML-BC060 TaxID=2842487 RepID=UPI00217F9668|nr:FtsK/SpoIIIE domain-containing protein [Bacillus sp. BML-BC060]